MTRKRVLGYVILHRHGHRAPEKNLFQRNNNEIQLWESLLPSSSLLQELTEKYPLKIHENNQKPQYDLKTKPFGCITNKGVNYLNIVGKQLKDLFPGLYKIRNIKIYATNYQRTQVSAQSLLSGLEAVEGSSIYVRESRNCSMSFSDEKATIVNKLIQQVQNEPFIRDTEKKLGPFILQTIPELGSKDIPGAVNWMATLDYFSCRLSHSLPLPPQLYDIHTPAIQYIAKRYKTETTYIEHQTYFSLPLLKELYTALLSCQNQTIENIPESSQANEDPAAIIFSGHDVNILDMLHSLDALVVHPDHMPLYDGGGHWPAYGSNLTFELTHDNINLYYNFQPLKIHYENQVVTSITLQQLEKLFK